MEFVITGDKSLIDLIWNGKIISLKLLRLLLRFTVGQYAVSGDINQFYYSFKIITDNWIFRKDLNPDGELMEGVIGVLIYGIQLVSTQWSRLLGW